MGERPPCPTCVIVEVGDAFERALAPVSTAPPRMRVDDVKDRVARYFGLPVGSLRGRSRSSRVTRPRQIAMYLARKITSESFPEIGERFGRDHATVLVACRRVEEMILMDAQVRHDVAEIERGFARE